MVADQAVIGRALVVGPMSSAEQIDATGPDSAHNRRGEGSVWDTHAHDFEQSDQLTKRVVAVLNRASAV